MRLFLGDDLIIDPVGQVHTSNLMLNVVFASVLVGVTALFCCFGMASIRKYADGGT
jgi:hypothetical protein